jgi:hypothetical protein
MQNIRPNFSRLIAFAIFGVLLVSSVGCSNSSGPPTSTFTVPKAGSTFIFYSYRIDTAGAIIANTEVSDTDIVIASGSTYQGRTNVNRFHTNKGGSDIFLNYETNGDISYYEDNSGKPGTRSGWITIPLGRKGKSSFISFDSTIESGLREQETASWTYTGDATVTFSNHDFHTQTFDTELDRLNGTHDPIQNYWFAPEIGFYVKESQQPGLSWNGTRVNGDNSELVSYVLK